MTDDRTNITQADVEWVVNSSQLSPRLDKKIHSAPRVGLINGLAVYGPSLGALLEIEVTAIHVGGGLGKINLTGIVDEEEMGGGSRTIRRKSMAKSSVENVLTVLRRIGLQPYDYDLHINFPGGIPIDGPSAGIALATAITSAILNIPIDNKLAMTGEVSIHGKVKPVGGIVAKVEAAFQAGAETVIIPKENWQELFGRYEALKIHPVDTIDEVLQLALGLKAKIDVSPLPAASAGDLVISPSLPLLQIKQD